MLLTPFFEKERRVGRISDEAYRLLALTAGSRRRSHRARQKKGLMFYAVVARGECGTLAGVRPSAARGGYVPARRGAPRGRVNEFVPVLAENGVDACLREIY